jgi:hypothetical protein
VFSVVSASLIATQRCGAVNQHATIEQAVFSVGATPRSYIEDLRQLYRIERLSGVAGVRIIEKKW